MKIFISADIEGVNHITSWDETNYGNSRYEEFRRQMTSEVKAACLGAYEAGAKEIYVKDAHDSARNILFDELPNYVKLHRGWEGGLASMMGGLDNTFDAVLFVGYHGPARNEGNPLAHTMTTEIVHVKINDKFASEFDINSLYASLLGVPVAFLSGDLALTKLVKETNPNIEVVATKEGRHGAVVSLHPSITNQQIEETVKKALLKDLSNNIVSMPKNFKVEIQYRTHKAAYRASLYPGCMLLNSDSIIFESKNYEDVLRMFIFNL